MSVPAQHINQDFVSQALEWLMTADFLPAMNFYAETLKDPNCDEWTIGELAKGDRYFLFVYVLNGHYGIHPWLYDRCREVQLEPDGCIDLWSREHFKSTLITYAGIIQEILNDPEITVGLFSHTRPIAKGCMDQIKLDFEGKQELMALYPVLL